MTPDPLEVAIDAMLDEVAGALTAGEPRRDFTSRVMARIARGDASRRGRSRAWLLVPLAAAAMILAMVFARGPQRTALLPVARGFQPGDRGPERTAPQDARPRDRGPERTAPQPVARGFQPRVRGPERAALHKDARPSPYALDPLVTAGIGVTPLTIDRLASDPIAIDRIDPITSVDVAPLTIDDPQRRQE